MKPFDSHKGVSKPRTLGHLHLGRDQDSSLTYLGVQQHPGEVTTTHNQKTKVCCLYHENQRSGMGIQFLNCFLFGEHVFWACRDQHSKDKPFTSSPASLALQERSKNRGNHSSQSSVLPLGSGSQLHLCDLWCLYLLTYHHLHPSAMLWTSGVR